MNEENTIKTDSENSLSQSERKELFELLRNLIVIVISIVKLIKKK